MTLHLIRHAHAVTADENPLRPLSGRGRDQVAQLVAFFRATGRLQPVEVWHSPLARSRETAALLAAGLGWNGPLRERPGLEPGDDPAATAAGLAGHADDLVIVGHEPHLGLLATLLVCGPKKEAVFALRKGACLAIDKDDSGWRIRWLVGPDLLGTGR